MTLLIIFEVINVYMYYMYFFFLTVSFTRINIKLHNQNSCLRANTVCMYVFYSASVYKV